MPRIGGSRWLKSFTMATIGDEIVDLDRRSQPVQGVLQNVDSAAGTVASCGGQIGETAMSGRRHCGSWTDREPRISRWTRVGELACLRSSLMDPEEARIASQFSNRVLNHNFIIQVIPADRKRASTRCQRPLFDSVRGGLARNNANALRFGGGQPWLALRHRTEERATGSSSRFTNKGGGCCRQKRRAR